MCPERRCQSCEEVEHQNRLKLTFFDMAGKTDKDHLKRNLYDESSPCNPLRESKVHEIQNRHCYL